MESVDYRIAPAETQIIKAFAIIAMVVHHLFLGHPEYGLVTYHVAIACKICVALFVFLSGYGMAATFPKDNAGLMNTAKTFLFFLAKRYAKFFLNYWVVFFVAVPIGIFCFGRTLEVAYGENADILTCLFKDLLGQQGFDSYNITWWFNELILALWILFPILYCSMKNVFVATVVLLLLFINPNEVLHKLEIFASFLSIYTLPFCVGIFMALHANRINKVLNFLQPKIVLFGSVIATIVLFSMRGIPHIAFFSYLRINALLSVALVLAVVSICRATKSQFTFLQYVGKHSMNMYLTHTFILGYFFGNFVYGLEYPIAMFVMVFGSSLLISVILEFGKRNCRFYQMQDRIVRLLTKHMPATGSNKL